MPCKTVTVPGPEDTTNGDTGDGGDSGNGDSTGSDLPPQLQKIVDLANENPMVTVGGLGAAGFLLMRPSGGGGNNPVYMPRPQDYDRDNQGRQK